MRNAPAFKVEWPFRTELKLSEKDSQDEPFLRQSVHSGLRQ